MITIDHSPLRGRPAEVGHFSQRQTTPDYGQAVVEWLEGKGRTFSSQEEEILRGGDDGLASSGVVVSPERAMAVSTVFACRRVIAEDLASMRIEVIRRTTVDGKRRTTILDNHELVPLLNPVSGRPNDWMTVWELMEHWVGIATMYRGGYIYVHREHDTIVDGARGSKGQVLELLPLLPNSVSVSYDAQWEPTYQVSGYGETWLADRHNLLRLHGPMDSMGAAGMAVSSVARNAIGLAAAVEGAAARFHKNDLRPAGVLSLKSGSLKSETMDQIRSQWKERYGPNGDGGIALLQGEYDFKTINATSADSQTIENRKFQVEEICRFFRVFPVAIGHQAGQGYGTVESFLEAHYTHTLKPWEIKIEQALNTTLLTPEQRADGHQIRLKPGRRGTFTDRVNAYKGALTAFMTPNEARLEEDMDPIDAPEMDRVQLPANNTGLIPGAKPGSTATDKPKPSDPQKDPFHAA